ncbi:MAG: 3-oxoadipate enol-lactonase [Gammaproteobacteria bacterium]|nr:3-oxoadipate enol-lactonase [Gammaproteobacteria bacterium]
MQINANGIDMHCELTGPDHAPVVMLSTSLATDLRMWQSQLPALRDDFRVLRYDTRGHGRTTAPGGGYTLSQLGNDACALLDALAIERVHWVGISMGGMIGQTLALEHPGRIASLTLADTASRVPAEARPAWEDRIALAERDGMEPLVEPTIERWFSPEFRRAQAPTVDRIRAMIRATPVPGYVGCCHAIMHLDLTARLGAIDAPTLVLVGEHDPGTPVAAAEVMAHAIAGATLSVLPRALHLANIEAAAQFNEALLRHLRALV